MVSFKKAAIEILKSSEEPLSAKEITDIALQKGLLDTEGQTPEATMGAQLYIDINKNKDSPFIKIGRGKFSLRKKEISSTSPLVLVEKQNENVKEKLKEKLHSMDPYQFEFFIADLLQKIGYENVQVTKRSGDGGIDITANLTVGGITDVETVIQVKRFRNNIPGRIIAQLRGSATIGQRGLVITTSDFTKNAIIESKDSGKMPVSLVNGEKLLKLIFKYGVGVKAEEKLIYSIDSDYFQNETSTLKKSISTEKNKSIWPLPGGNMSYVDTLNKFLEAIVNGQNTKKKLIQWYMKNFENVQSEKTADGYVFVPKSMGLINIKDGIYTLSEDGTKYYESKSLDSLFGTISKNIYAFEDIVEYLKTAESPQTEEEILEYLKENLDVEWTTFAQVNFRLLWLINLKIIVKNKEGYSINNGMSNL